MELNLRNQKQGRGVGPVSKCVRGNSDLCMGCRTCLIACVEAHSKRPVFEMKPGELNFNPKLHMIKTFDITVPFQCRHCENPECIKACKKDAIFVDEEGRVLVDEEKCDGCMDCMEACPIGAIDMAPACLTEEGGEIKYVANKCDLCKGVEGGPACIRVCPTDALRLVETSEVCDDTKLKRAGQMYKSAMISGWLSKKKEQNDE